MSIDVPLPDTLTGYIEADINRLERYLNEFTEVFSKFTEVFGRYRLAKTSADYANHYANAFSSSFAYEFADDDLKRMQTLINELRDLVANSKYLEEDHRTRLIKRLEALQAELYKKVSDLDRFWGLVGDAGVALAKLGENAKPIVDRIREIASITWRTQKKAEQLPDETPNPMIDSE